MGRTRRDDFPGLKRDTNPSRGVVSGEVIVVTVRSGYRQATLGTWGNRGMSFGGFTTDPKGFVTRRLLVDTGADVTVLGKNGDVLDKAWNLTSPVVAESSLRIASMYEHTRVVPEGEDRTSLRERWIPNTGEYLRFDAYVTMRNAAGAALDPDIFFPDGVKVAIGAKDRNYAEASAVDSNITKNTGTGFSLAGGFDNGNSFLCDIDTLTRGPSDENYVNTVGGGFWLTSSGLVVAKKVVEKGYTCIRPLPAESATVWIRPGDDIILTASLSSDTGITITDKAIESLPSDYLAVYDKKMLWRANLYIAEPGAGGPASTDWNDLHPWNAPPAAGVPPVGGDPVWGLGIGGTYMATYWGYNEWNRVHDGSVSASSIKAITGLSELPPGNGNQVIKLITFTPIRTLAGTEAARADPPSTNWISGTVAYSYPDHFSEPRVSGTSGWHGSAGSMDSPFDYNKKMQMQVSLLGSWYNSAGIMFEKSRESWPDKDATTTAGFEDWIEYKKYVTGSNARQIIPPEIFSALNKDSAGWESIAALNAALLRWERVTPPDDRWWRYVVAIPISGWTNTSSTFTMDFVPSQGLKYMAFIDTTKNTYDENFEPAIAGITRESFLKQDYVIEAGTDCVGFAQRAASWDNNPYTFWNNITKGWTEQSGYLGDANIWTQLNKYTHTWDTARQYPQDSTEVTEGVAAYKIIDHAVNGAYAEDFLSRLRMVVPGDIWVKDSASESDISDEKKDHIAIVAWVPANATELSDTDLMNQIVLIEGEFTNRIQSVIKKLSVGMYNGGEIPYSTEIYGATFITPAQGQGAKISLNCQSWAIRRLK